MGEVKITADNIHEFEKAYNQCEDGGVFDFKGKKVLKSYAKYVLQYFAGNGYVLMSPTNSPKSLTSD